MTLSMKEAEKRAGKALRTLIDACDERQSRIISSAMSKAINDSDAKVADVIVALVSHLASLTMGHDDDDTMVFIMMVTRLLSQATTTPVLRQSIH